MRLIDLVPQGNLWSVPNIKLCQQHGGAPTEAKLLLRNSKLQGISKDAIHGGAGKDVDSPCPAAPVLSNGSPI